MYRILKSSLDFTKQKMVTYSISSTLNPTLESTADRMIASTETEAFALACWINMNILLCSEARLRNFKHFFFKKSFFFFLYHRESKEIVFGLPATFLSFGCLCLGILGFKSEQYFNSLECYVFNFTATSAVCMFSLLASFKIIFL